MFCLCYTAQVAPYTRPLVLAIKKWAKIRGINDAGAGTFSSYAWVMLVLHYLQWQGLLPDLLDPDLVVPQLISDTACIYDLALCSINDHC